MFRPEANDTWTYAGANDADPFWVGGGLEQEFNALSNGAAYLEWFDIQASRSLVAVDVLRTCVPPEHSRADTFSMLANTENLIRTLRVRPNVDAALLLELLRICRVVAHILPQEDSTMPFSIFHALLREPLIQVHTKARELNIFTEWPPKEPQNDDSAPVQ